MKTILIFCSLVLFTGFNSSSQTNVSPEELVVDYFKDQYQSGSLMTIVNGFVVKLNKSKHSVYIDTTLISSSNLGFFEDKYPEFIAPLSNENDFIDSSILENNSVSMNGFKFTRAADFLRNKSNYKEGSLSITISKAFYFKGAYYVHAWLINHDKKFFHHKRCTFKFDQQKTLIGTSCENHYQTSYSGVSKYLESIGVLVVGD